jgi:hypothetical protein
VALPFAEALAAVASETALLVGVPAGVAWAAAHFVRQGESRSLAALGVSPLGNTRGLLLPVGVASLLSCFTTLAWPPSTDQPG